MAVAGLVLLACGPAGSSAPRDPESPQRSRSVGESAHEVVQAVAELSWTGSPPATELAASEPGQRAIAALVTWAATHPAIAIPCTDPDQTILSFVKRAMPFTMAVIASSTGPDDAKVTALLHFAKALRSEHNDGLAIMVGIQIPTAMASYWRDRPLSPERFVQLGLTDLDVVHMGQSMLDCKIKYLSSRRSGFERREMQDRIEEGRRRLGLRSDPGWFEAELAMHDQFLAETRRLMAAAHTGEQMVSFVEGRVRLGAEAPSALVRIVTHGLEGDAIVTALQKANSQVSGYRSFVSSSP